MELELYPRVKGCKGDLHQVTR